MTKTLPDVNYEIKPHILSNEYDLKKIIITSVVINIIMYLVLWFFMPVVMPVLLKKFTNHHKTVMELHNTISNQRKIIEVTKGKVVLLEEQINILNDKISNKFDTLEGMTKKIDSNVKNLEKTVTTLKTEPINNAFLEKIEYKAQAGVPFLPELEALSLPKKYYDLIPSLRKVAAEHTPTMQQLTEEWLAFINSNNMVKAKIAKDPSNSWWKNLWQSVISSISIEKINPSDQHDLKWLVMDNLKNHNLNKAIEITSEHNLNEKWLRKAKKRLDLDNMINKLFNLVKINNPESVL